MVTILQYERIKEHIRKGIETGAWSIGAKIPSENELARKFAISRMTANRAINELASEGVLERIQGKGTYVSAAKPLQSVLRIEGIDEEIRGRGNEYSIRLLQLAVAQPNPEVWEMLGVPMGARLFYSRVVHLENDIPLQLEERWVNPKLAPRYLQQDFRIRTPHAYLMATVPLSRGVHTIEACRPEPRVARTLRMANGEPCLLIYRRTWADEAVASFAKLYHPGSRYQLRTDWS